MSGLAPHDPCDVGGADARPAASKASRAPLTARRLRVFDTETTGLDTETDRVVQFGTATFQNGALLRLQDTLVNPCKPIPAAASDVHQIFDGDVEDAQTFGTVGDTFAQQLRQTDDTILCAYNGTHYDVPLLNAEFERHCYEFRIDPTRVLDPLVWLRYYHRAWPSRRLAAVAERLDVPLADAHRASADAEATGHVLYRLIEAGIVPDDVEEALAAQAQIVKVLSQEDETYGRFLYVDRENAALLRVGIGKHAGKLLRDVPTSYLRWMLRLPDLPHLAASEIRVYA
jgi:DNA polymerase-3 subunit epsilon